MPTNPSAPGIMYVSRREAVCTHCRRPFSTQHRYLPGEKPFCHAPGCQAAKRARRRKAAPMRRIARVFPSRTRATPDDPLAFVGGPGLFPPEVDAVHISVTFDWDRPEAERLAREWEQVAPVLIGGPSFDRENLATPPFTPGVYLKPGYVVTSRGCPNARTGKCWFCREVPGPVELPITDGWNVLDPNLLACSQGHIDSVLDMLKRQPRQPEFTGGLEAARITPALAQAIRSVRPKTLFLAYDTPDDWQPLVRAAEMLWDAGFTKASHNVRAYVLVGWPKDTMEAAEKRLRQVLSLGIVPMAMLWRGKTGKRNPAWRTFQRIWARPASVCAQRCEVPRG